MAEPRVFGVGTPRLSPRGAERRALISREWGMRLISDLGRLVDRLRREPATDLDAFGLFHETFASLQAVFAEHGRPIALAFDEDAVFVGGRHIRATKPVYDAAKAFWEPLWASQYDAVSFEPSLRKESLAVFLRALALSGGVQKTALARIPRGEVLLVPARAKSAQSAEPFDREGSRFARAYARAVASFRRLSSRTSDEHGGDGTPAMRRVVADLMRVHRFVGPRVLRAIFSGSTGVDLAPQVVAATYLSVTMARLVVADEAKLEKMAWATALTLGARRDLSEFDSLGGDERRSVRGAPRGIPDWFYRTKLWASFSPEVQDPYLWAYEAVRLLGPDLRGGRSRPPTGARMPARIVASSIAFSEHMVSLVADRGIRIPTDSELAAGFAHVAKRASEVGTRATLRLLAAAFGIVPEGTIVRLSSGELAEVQAKNGAVSMSSDVEHVRVVLDSNEEMPDESKVVPVRFEGTRCIVRVVNIDGWGSKDAAPMGKLQPLPRPALVSEPMELGDESEFLEVGTGEIVGLQSAPPPNATVESADPMALTDERPAVLPSDLPGAPESRGTSSFPLREDGGLATEDTTSKPEEAPAATPTGLKPPSPEIRPGAPRPSIDARVSDDDVEAAFERVTSLVPPSPAITAQVQRSLDLAQRAVARKELEEADWLLRDALRIDERHAGCQALLVWVDFLRGQISSVEALGRLSAVLRRHEFCESAMVYRARLHSRAGRRRLAIVDYERVLAMNPTNGEAQKALADLRARGREGTGTSE